MTININQSREHLLDFLENNHIGMLATSSVSGKPHSAAVYLTYDQDLNLYFVTRKGTRKSRNLQENSQVSITIYNAALQTTLQAEGTAIEVAQPPKMQWIFNDIWRIATQQGPNNQPPQAQLIGSGDYIAYKISAPFLRLAAFAQSVSAKPEDIFTIIPTQGNEHFNAHNNV